VVCWRAVSKQTQKLHEEISLLRKQLEEAINRANFTEAMRFTIKELFVVATATLLAFCGLVVENETIVCVLLAVTGLAYIYVCIKHPSTVRVRVLAAGAVFVVFVAMIIFVYERGLRKEQEDVRTGLHAIVNLPPSKINTDSTFTIINDSHYAIGWHSVFCKIVEGSAPHSHFTDSGTRTTANSTSVIEPGGDAETSGCLKDLYGNTGFTLAGGDSSLTCMDIMVGINYSLVEQPKTVSNKSFRFISTADNGNEWLHLRLGTEVSPCHVRH
jgi:hypothetical protein